MSTRGLKPSPYRVFLHECGRYPSAATTAKPPSKMPSGIGRAAAVAAAERAAGWLPGFASALYRDARAPVNLTSIAGLAASAPAAGRPTPCPAREAVLGGLGPVDQPRGGSRRRA